MPSLFKCDLIIEMLVNFLDLVLHIFLFNILMYAFVSLVLMIILHYVIYSFISQSAVKSKGT